MLRFEIFVPLVFVLAAVFYALLGLYAWRKRPAVGVTSFAWVMLSMSIWSFAYGLEIFVPMVQIKILAINFEYIGIVGVPVFLFFFALEYTGRSHLITPRLRTIVWVLPILTLLMVWTNPLHNIMWKIESVSHIGTLSLLTVRFGLVFWVHMLFVFGMIVTSGILLIMDFLQRPGTLRLQLSLVIVGLIFSFLGAAIFVTGFGPIKNLDLSSLFFLPAAIGLAWVTLQYRLSEILSLEHTAVLKNMRDSVIVLNNQKRILYINHITEKLLNRTEDEVIGQPFQKVAKPFANILDAHFSDGEHRVEIQTDTGEEAKTYEVAISSIAAARQGLSNIVISLHDITERKEKEQELTRHGSIMSAISHAAERFLKAAEWEQNIPDVLKDLGRAADVSRVLVLLNSVDATNNIFATLQYEWSAPDQEPQINNPACQQIAITKTKLDDWVTILKKGQPIQGSVRELPEAEQEILKSMGCVSFAAVPIFVNGKWWASMLFNECRRERQWTSIEMEAFQTAASIFGAAETQSLTEKKLIRRQLAMVLLQDIVTVSLQATNMREMGDTVANRLAQLIHADGCFLTLWDDVNQRTIPFAAYGAQKQVYAEIEIEPNEITFTRSALEMERILIIEDTGSTPYASPSVTSSFPSKSLLVLPLIAMEKKLGAVLVSFNDYHHFEREEVQICEQATSLIALALEKFQAVDDAKRRAETSETLRKAGIAVAEQFELRDTVNRVLDQLKQMVPYDSASVQLRDGDELYIVGGYGWQDTNEVINLRFSIPGDNPNTVVIETGSPYYLPNAGEVYKQFKVPPHDHICSWLGIPLIVQDKIIGLLAIDSAEPNDFSEREIMIATEFANQVSITLENARILKETQHQAMTDPLTGVHNRRRLMELGEIEFSRAQLMHRSMSAIMLDIDHFKKVNDTYGHAAGDIVLREFAKRCKSCIREIDHIGRYGGEEVVILLPDTGAKASRIVAERLRMVIAATPIQLTKEEEIKISASLGVACKDEATTNLDMLIARADQAMYTAKHNGRNRVAFSN